MIESLAPILLGGVLALAGTLIGPIFQHRHERWKADRADRSILREKAEELFDELDLLVTASQAASITVIAMAKGDDVAAKPVPDLGKARSIAAIYFPSALDIIGDYEKQNLEFMNWVVSQTEEAIKAGAQGLGTLRGLPMIVTIENQKRAVMLVNDLRAHLSANVPKLELDDQ